MSVTGQPEGVAEPAGPTPHRPVRANMDLDPFASSPDQSPVLPFCLFLGGSRVRVRKCHRCLSSDRDGMWLCRLVAPHASILSATYLYANLATRRRCAGQRNARIPMSQRHAAYCPRSGSQAVQKAHPLQHRAAACHCPTIETQQADKDSAARASGDVAMAVA